MRILFLDQFSESGGAQLCLRDVLAEVRQRGWEAEVMAPGEGPLMDYARSCGFSTASLPISEYSNGRKTLSDITRYGVDLVRASRAVRNQLRRWPADLIYVNGPRALPVIWGIIRTPVVFHAHSLLEKTYARRIAVWSLKDRRAMVLACSRFAAGPLRTAFGVQGVKVIYNGVSDQGFRPQSAVETPVHVGIIGRIAPEKGHLDFIRAAKLVSTTNNVRFTVIGAALFSHPEHEREVRALGTAYGVHFSGWADDVSQALHRLNILAVPSAAIEASSRVIMEAFSAGTCVVSYPSGGIPEIVRDGDTGLLTDAPAYDSLARSIRKLADNPGLRARLVENGRREWEQRFRVQRFQREVCDTLQRMVSAPGNAATLPRSAGPEQEFAHDGTPFQQ